MQGRKGVQTFDFFVALGSDGDASQKGEEGEEYVKSKLHLP